MNALGYKYQFATGIPKDMDKAIHWYCEAVAAGNPRAMNNLAIILDEGQDLPRDLEEARSLWKQAAALGHVNSMGNLGWSYLSGAERNANEAKHWLLLAAQAGHAGAQKWARANGFNGSWSAPVDPAALMTPYVRREGVRSKICGSVVS